MAMFNSYVSHYQRVTLATTRHFTAEPHLHSGTEHGVHPGRPGSAEPHHHAAGELDLPIEKDLVGFNMILSCIFTYVYIYIYHYSVYYMYYVYIYILCIYI